MSAYTGRLACVRCGAEEADDAPWTGCHRCRAGGIHANLLPVYCLDGMTSPPERPDQPGVFRWRDLLPVPSDAIAVSLFEGGTPLLAADRLAAEIGVGELWFKDESRNPTWSYKDRLAAVAVTVACSRGAKTVALATSGNHGAAAAAYAAAAGLRCVVLTMASVPKSMKVLMQSYGATVVAFERAPDRWKVLADAVDAWGWTPLSGFMDPPLGSNPFGVDGYKTLAYELVLEMDRPPTIVIVPTAYADGLTGIQRGFADLEALGVIDRQPRLVAVDPFGAYVAALSSGDGSPTPVRTSSTVAFSIGTPIATYQGLGALRASGGTAVGVADDTTIMAAQRRLASTIGVFAEATSAICLPGLAKLVASGAVTADDRVVCIATSGGLKDVDATAAHLQPVPVIAPELSALEAALAVTSR